MVDINQSSLDEAARGPRKPGFLAAIGGPQFLVAQLFTIAATILGVYLAGYVGFQRTLEYDRLVKAQQQANMLHALHAELKDNTERLNEFVKVLDKTFEGHPAYGEWPRMRVYVWRAAAENSALFDTPPQIIVAMQTFYEEIGDKLTSSEMQKAFRSITSSNQYDRKTFTDKLKAQIETVETNVLSELLRAAGNAEQAADAISNAGS